MRRVSLKVLRGGALLTFLAILIAPAVYADDPNPFDPPEARIKPPGGVAAQQQGQRILPPIGTAVQAEVRIHPPGGVAGQEQQRIGPPGGVAAQQEAPSMIELFWAWLQQRIGPPTG